MTRSNLRANTHKLAAIACANILDEHNSMRRTHKLTRNKLQVMIILTVALVPELDHQELVLAAAQEARGLVLWWSSVSFLGVGRRDSEGAAAPALYTK